MGYAGMASSMKQAMQQGWMEAAKLVLCGTFVAGAAYAQQAPVLIPNVVTTIAGNPQAASTTSQTFSFAGEGVAATTASLYAPAGIAVDPAGNVYFTDSGNNIVREINAQTGFISTIAGIAPSANCAGNGYSTSPNPCYTVGTAIQDGVLATKSALKLNLGNNSSTDAIAVDSLGNVFFFDYTSAVRVVYKSGAALAATIMALEPNVKTVVPGYIYTIVGSSGNGNPAVGSQAPSAAKFSGLNGLSVDTSGNLYIFDSAANVRVVNIQATSITVFGVTIPAGQIAVVAGSCTTTCTSVNSMATVNGTPTTSPLLQNVRGGYVDASGNAYVVTVNGSGANALQGVEILYSGGGSANPATNLIAKLNPSLTPTANTQYGLYGRVLTPATGFNQPANSYQSGWSLGATTDSAGNVYIADFNNTSTCGNANCALVRVDAVTGSVTSIAGPKQALGTATPSAPAYCSGASGPQTTDFVGDGCSQTSVSVSPFGVALDAAGNLYIADHAFNLIRKVLIGTQFPSTTVGATAASQVVRMKFYSGNLPAATGAFTIGGTSADFALTASACTVNTGDATQDCLLTLMFTPKGAGTRTGELLAKDAAGVTHSYALTGIGTAPSVLIDTPTGTALGSGFTSPSGVAVDAVGNVYTADTGNNRVTVTAAGATSPVVLVANTLSISGSTLKAPQGVAVDAAGNVYIADTGNSRVLKLATGTTAPTVMTGSYNKPASVAIDRLGNLYVADTGNARVVIVPSPSTTASFAPEAVGTGTIVLSKPVAVAVDVTGNLFIGDSGLNQVIQVPFSDVSGVQSATPPAVSVVGGSSSFSTISGVAVDAAGTVYVTDSAKNSFFAIPKGSASPVALPLSGLLNPAGLAFDTSGNLYLADVGNNRLLFLNRVNPTINYNAVNIGSTSPAQSVVVSNNGNSTTALTLTGLSISPSDFSQAQTATNACGATTQLSPGAECSLSIAYAPTPSASGNGSLVLTDNALGVAGATQTVPLLAVGTKPQTITFAGLPGVVYGQAPITLTATASSGLPVLYTVTGPATVSGSTLAITGAGSVCVTATQPGSGSGYAAATPVQQCFTVAKAVLTVTGGTIGLGLGQTVPNPYPYTIIGYVNGDTSSILNGGQPSLTTNPASPTAAGTYPITVTVGTLPTLANYTYTFVNGSLQIANNSQTITFPTINGTGTAVYGATPITLTATATATPVSTYPITYQSSDTTIAQIVPSGTGYALKIVGAGTVQITAIQAGDGTNYPRVTTVQTFVVTKSVLTVTANNQKVVFGQTVGAYTATLTGFVNGDTTAVVSGTPSLTTTPSAPTAVGTYTIVAGVGTLSAANYTFTPANGLLTIAGAPLVLTIGNGTSAYGASLPTNYTVAATGLLGADTIGTTLTVTFVYPQAAIAGSPVGNYTVSATLTGTSAANYAVTVVPGTLSITPLALSAIPAGTSFSYGGTVPPISGVLNTLLPQDVGKVSPLFTTTATSTSPAGKSYPIALAGLTGASASNYTALLAGSATVTITQAATLTLISAATASVTSGANPSVLLTASVSSTTSGAPTGTVTFFDSGVQIAGTSNPAAVVNGTATFSTASFAIGTTHYLTATYNGDGNFTQSTSAVFPETPGTPAFTVTVPASLTMQRGTVGSVTVIVAPQGGYTGTVTFGCNGLPQLATCTFSSPTVTLSGSTTASQVLTLSVTSLGPSTYTMLRGLSPHRPGTEFAALAFFPVGLLALCFGTRRKRMTEKMRRLLVVVLMASALAAATGCGGTPTYTPTGTYNVTVTAAGTPAAGSGIPASTINSSLTLTITN